MEKCIKINGRLVGEGALVYVIAEIGINHNGDFEVARELIDNAHSAGADAVKLQTYITEKRVAKDSPIFAILKQCELSLGQQERLFNYAREKGIDIFSTPFDAESVDFLASISSPCYKVASFDIVNKQLLKKIAKVNKPVIISRGMSSQEEINTAVAIMQQNGVPFALLHCVSAYPVNSCASLNLRTINALKEKYSCPVGFSDHTLGTEIPKYAVCAGASIIEKHFTLSRQAKGPDHVLSVEPQELKEIVSSIRHVEEMLGEVSFSAVQEEADILQYRRVT